MFTPLPRHLASRRLGSLLPIATLLVLVPVMPTRAAALEVPPVESPDGRVRVSLEMPAPGSKAPPAWSATFRGRTLLTDCALGLEIADGGELTAGARLLKTGRRSVNKRVPVLFGRSSQTRDRFHEIRYSLENQRGKRSDLVFRCYDDAIAFRYELARVEGAPSSVTVVDESTAFRLKGDPTGYVQYLENYQTSHEHNVVATPYSRIRPDTLLDLPLTFTWEDRTCVAITEASLRHYAGLALMRPAGDAPPGDYLAGRLTPRKDGTKVVRLLPMQTPWRVVLIGERPGRLLESETLYCLNDPPAFKDTSWIEPAKITFPWWNGDVYDGKPGPPILSFEMAKRYIDFCASNGIPVHAMTSTEGTVTPWYHQSKPGVEPGPDTDVTRPRPGFELARIREYAKSKGIRLWTWVHQGALRGRVDEAFAAFEKMGWSGMMVDFFDHDDQETIEFAESVLAAAARHRILIHLHGVWKPTGWERTYPNLMNHEGALNLEYLKWSDRCTPEHNLLLAYTRLIAGRMDYHLGGFRSVPASAFKPRNVAPNVLGTRCHMLAMYVCFDNPAPMVADYPTAYEGQPGFEFLKAVPTWWDETRILVDEIGEVLVTARRKDKAWYIGGMSAHSRDVTVPLSSLGRGRFTARIWRDAPDAAQNPNHLFRETKAVSRADALSLHVAAGGGFVIEVTPGGL